MNEILSSSFLNLGIWLYPEYASKKLRMGNLDAP